LNYSRGALLPYPHSDAVILSDLGYILGNSHIKMLMGLFQTILASLCTTEMLLQTLLDVDVILNINEFSN